MAYVSFFDTESLPESQGLPHQATRRPESAPPAPRGAWSAPQQQEARQGGRAALAEALRAARGRTLALFAAYKQALATPTLAVPYAPERNPPLWELGHIGWFADWWIARNPRRAEGTACPPDTGASRKARPLPLATSRAVATSIVEQSIRMAEAGALSMTLSS